MDTQFSNELQRLECMTGYQYIAPATAANENMPYYSNHWLKVLFHSGKFWTKNIIIWRKQQFIRQIQTSSRFLALAIPDSKVHGANMGPTWVLLAPDGPHVGPMNLAIRDQGVQPRALTKFPDYSLTFPWPFGVFPWPRDKILTFHYRLNTHLACNLTNHTPKLAITKK